MRNEANWVFKGLETLQFAQRASVGALGRIDAALEPHEDAVAIVECLAYGTILVELPGGLHFIFPDFRVSLGEAPELPVVADESVDIVTLLGRGGVEALDVIGGEGVEIGDGFAADEVRLSVDAGLQG